MHPVLPLLFLLLIVTAPAATIPGKPPGQKSTTGSGGKVSKSNDGGKKKASEEQQEKHQTKYFHEAGGTLELGHYDARFFQGAVAYEEHVPALRHLVRSWLATTRAIGVADTWLAHGTLLGWWWNGRVMPWDYDLDVQMPTSTLTRLGRYYNRTMYDYSFEVEDGEEMDEERGVIITESSSTSSSSSKKGKKKVSVSSSSGGGFVNKTYLLDINPHHTDAGRGNGANVIDARWIDVSNGLFVDITGLAERDPAGSPGVWSCKNAHRYRTTELFPLRRTEFEGVPASVPYAFDKILTDEYGAKSLVSTEWAGHRWTPELKEWVKIPAPPADRKEKGGEIKINNHQQQNQQQQQDSNAVVVVVEKTVVKGGTEDNVSTETRAAAAAPAP
ncbi:mannosyltransferase [Parahypoxylon ruwenzoriense]